MIKVYYVSADTDPVGGARNAAKIPIALREIGERFETVDLSREKDLRPKDSWYRRRINPNGLVPAIDDDGFVLWESVAILRYLGDTRGKIFPPDPRDKALVQQWLSWEAEDYNADLINLFYLNAKEVASDPAAFPTVIVSAKNTPEALRVAQEKYAFRIGMLEDQLQGQEFIVGEFSAADIALACHVVLSPLMGFDLKPYTNVAAWLHRLAARPSFQQEKIFINDYRAGKATGLL
jgi:glutathione S-transferase